MCYGVHVKGKTTGSSWSLSCLCTVSLVVWSGLGEGNVGRRSTRSCTRSVSERGGRGRGHGGFVDEVTAVNKLRRRVYSQLRPLPRVRTTSRVSGGGGLNDCAGSTREKK